MKRVILSMLAVSALVVTSCSSDSDETPQVVAPTTYTFVGKDGKSNVSFTGQEARWVMASELKSALGGDTKTLAQLNEMFKDGKGFVGTIPSNGTSVNDSGKKLRETVASATNSNTTTVEEEALRTKLDGYLAAHAAIDFNADASNGTAGKLETVGGGRTVYVDAKGYEMNQAVAKTLIGSVFVDQIVNKYVSEGLINESIAGNNTGTPHKDNADNNYTSLQHYWDEAYGYTFGLETTPATPVNDSSNRKGFLNSYLTSVDGDPKFNVFDEIYDAFKLGRAAIDAKQYDVVHAQAKIIRENVSLVIGVMAAHYLQKGKGVKNPDSLHALSEAVGFVQSLRFAHVNGVQIPQNSVDQSLAPLANLWTVTDAQLDQVAGIIAQQFGFNVEDVIDLKN
ncbi:hypothetical protein WH52_00250 [Tenacibaculum holothuriorum]|uniref:DUF4856 domain-containing protein n=1 Tax=Tenacibaculum holothuriorum TaxID=1635173 RepID=A0A1Y2PF53_9FLAO|nr:DUF4856 domain-containing protein [Tenacibaculum holothuriorum]OSY89126.1 hypothetical protein WH52_00250 [Tenacibaculum holothuriorum]